MIGTNSCLLLLSSSVCEGQMPSSLFLSWTTEAGEEVTGNDGTKGESPKDEEHKWNPSLKWST